MKRLSAFLACLALGAFATDAVATSFRLTVSPTPSGSINTRYRDGNDGLSVVWGTIPTQTFLTTDTVSVNLCALLTTGSASATLSSDASFPLPAGFSLSGTRNCNLTASSPSATNTAVRVVATVGSDVATSSTFSIVVTAPNPTDVTPPNRILGVVCAELDTNTVRCQGDSPSDPYNSAAGSGTVTIKGYAGASSAGSIAATGPGLSPNWTQTDPSGVVDTSSYSATSAWSITSSGATGGTSYAATWTTQISSFTGISSRVTMVTPGSLLAKCGKYIGASANSFQANDGWLAYYLTTSTTSTSDRALAVRYRPAGGSATTHFTLALPSGTTAVYLNLVPTGVANEYAFQYSTDGSAWASAGANRTITLPEVRYIGLFVDGGTSGANGSADTTCQFLGTDLRNQPRWTFDYDTLSTVSMSFAAVDDEGNEQGTKSVAVSVAPVPSAPDDEGLIYSQGFELSEGWSSGQQDATSIGNRGWEFSRHQGRTDIDCTRAYSGSCSLRLRLGPGFCANKDTGAQMNPCYGTAREEIYPNGEQVVAGAGALGTTCSTDSTRRRCMFNQTRAVAEGDEVWMGFAIYFAKLTTTSRFNLFQLQQGGTASCGFGQPFFAHYLSDSGAGWSFINRPWVTQNTCNASNAFGSFQQNVLGTDKGSVPLNQWVKFVYRFKFDGSTAPNVGRVTVWQDGVQLIDANNIQFSYEAVGSFMQYMHGKLPLYHWWSAVAGDFDFYIDSYKVSLPNEGSFDLVNP